MVASPSPKQIARYPSRVKGEGVPCIIDNDFYPATLGYQGAIISHAMPGMGSTRPEPIPPLSHRLHLCTVVPATTESIVR